jgi:predicted transglutaminase-like cysteine proteinase
VLAIIACLAGASQALAGVVYPVFFDAKPVRVAGLNHFAKWDGVLARHREQIRHAGSCEETWYSRCPLSDWQKLLAEQGGDDRWSQLEAVNAWINRYRYVSDSRNWRTSDHWSTPLELMQRGGDCEDFAIAKYISLRRLGVRSEAMRVVIVRDTRRDIVHAVLVVNVGDRPVLLDNLYNRPVFSSEIKHYVPIYSVGESGVWRHFRVRTTEQGEADPAA